MSKYSLIKFRKSSCLSIDFNPSFSKPFTKGGGGVEPTPIAISKTVAPMNLKFCRVLETPMKVLEMLKLFT